MSAMAMAEPQYDFMQKLVLVGDANVGKTALIERFVHDRFNPEQRNTVGSDIAVRTCVVHGGGRGGHGGGATIKLQVWDTAGSERFRSSMSTMSFRGADGVLLLFSLTNRESFEHVDEWRVEAERNVREGVPVLLVGTKRDASRQVTAEEATAYADRLGVPFVEASAATGENCERVFNALAAEVLMAVTNNVLSPRLPQSGAGPAGCAEPHSHRSASFVVPAAIYTAKRGCCC